MWQKLLRMLGAPADQVPRQDYPPQAFGSFGAGASIGRNVEIVGPLARIHLGPKVRIGDGARLVCSDEHSTIELGEATVIQPRAYLETGPAGRIVLGARSSVNPYCVIYGHGGFVAGDYVRIAAHTVVIPANHLYDDPDVPITRQGLRKLGIQIANDVWIGAGCRILDGVRIGQGAVVAAGAVVNRDVPEFHVVGGVPARVLKRRGHERSPDSSDSAATRSST